MLDRFLRVQDKPTARHSPVVAFQKVHKRGCRVVPLGSRSHALDPVLEGDQVGDVERIRQDGIHLAPRLTDWVVNVIYWVRGAV